MKTLKNYQLIETKKEVNNYLKNGAVLVSLDEYKKMLSYFGLKLCLNTNNYLLKYYNTSNKQHYLCATTTALEQNNVSGHNIYGQWYKDNVVKKTKLYYEFKEFRYKYFTILRGGYILSI